MGSKPSAVTTTEKKDHSETMISAGSESGRKQILESVNITDDVAEANSSPSISTTDDESSVVSDDSSYQADVDSDWDEYEGVYDSDDEEEDEEWNERLAILEETRKLRQLAEFFLHPEKPVVTSDATATARCFFSRPSAPEQTPPEEEAEVAAILADAKALKASAVDHLRPERPVVTADASACGRNYFARPSAPEQLDPDEAEEQARILEDMAALKKLAIDYLHPEKPVVTSDPFACGRNYFSRPSAEEYEDEEEAEIREQVLADMAALKQLAVNYLHPEKPVVTSDPFACGRNYFTRPSADEYEDEEAMDDRDEIMEDMAGLKKLAIDYMHPERPVEVDPTCFGRNYFNRPSAPEQETQEEAEERAAIFADMASLKKLAVDYLHPEKPVITSDPYACGRNYFTRPSAPEQESYEDMEERAQILSEMAALKQLAVDYLHPEKPVVTSDPFACGRNYFTRPSADEYEDEEAMDDRDEILEDMAALKQLAVDYLHPERPVEVDPTCFGRNYFTRPSAPEQETQEEAEERAAILADTAALKKLAVDYLHPEKPVITSDPFACGRNYFTRPSAPDQETQEEAEERAQILSDMAALKKLAVDYLHPEKPVVTSDPFACGRDYFARPSAEEYEDEEEREARDQIMSDMLLLKQLAVDYLHPEKPVQNTDSTTFGRNYFSRPSAPEQESKEDMEERALVLAEAMSLKRLAMDYLQPERPVEIDAFAKGRNFFNRPSAAGDSDDYIHTYVEDEEEHALLHDPNPHHKSHHVSHAHHRHSHHDDDQTATTAHSYSDHFEMDEDMFTEFRHSLIMSEPFKGEHPSEYLEDVDEGEEEGKLSRSPSSVMLFTEEAM